jgi:Fic family protein
MAVNDIFSKIDRYRKLICRHIPTNKLEITNLNEYFRIEFTYSSNALEGNPLTIIETKILLEDGLTVGGKPIIYYLEALGHSDAYSYMLELSNDDNLKLSEEIILHLHKMFYYRIDSTNAGKYRDIDVYITGSDHALPKHKELHQLMKEFVDEINQLCQKIHPVQLAAYAHLELVSIHPFVDGNGRIARLLMNLILLNNKYQLAIIPPVLRSNYIQAIQKSQKFNIAEPFITFIAECELTSQIEFCRLLGITEKI